MPELVFEALSTAPQNGSRFLNFFKLRTVTFKCRVRRLPTGPRGTAARAVRTCAKDTRLCFCRGLCIQGMDKRLRRNFETQKAHLVSSSMLLRRRTEASKLRSNKVTVQRKNRRLLGSDRAVGWRERHRLGLLPDGSPPPRLAGKQNQNLGAAVQV